VTGGGYDRVFNLSQTNPTQRLGAVVKHPAQAWTATTHLFLRFLEQHDFAAAPKVVGSGFDEHCNETLEWLPGIAITDRVWPAAAESLFTVGRMLRQLHTLATEFMPPTDAVWMPWTLRDDGPGAVVSHGNIAPWHLLFEDDAPTGILGWEYAGPVQPLDEVAATGWFCAQLMDDDVAQRVGLPDAAARGDWLRAFVDGYELSRSDRDGLVTRMIEFAIKDTAGFARLYDFTPDSTQAEHLWLLSWQSRAALWMLENRATLTEIMCGRRSGKAWSARPARSSASAKADTAPKSSAASAAATRSGPTSR